MFPILIFFIINSIIFINTKAIDDELGNSTYENTELTMAPLEMMENTTDCLANTTLPHSSNCMLYYRCNNGVPTLVQCDPTFLFDSKSLECVPENEAICGKNQENSKEFCQYQADGLYPDYSKNCLQYFRCQSGHTVSKTSCPKNQVFSFYQQNCVNHMTGSCVKPSCSPNNNYFFWLPTSFCRSYYYCQTNTPILFNCPPGKVFNHFTKDCVAGGQCFEPICTGKKDGNHSDTTHECRRYLQCKGGSLVGVTSCPQGQVHNGYTCVPEEFSQCPKPETTAVSVETIRDDCRGYSDGPHVIPATNCQRYQICQDGMALARFVCPTGTIFDGINCASENTTSCHDICAGKTNGYQPDKREGCRKYHYCNEGKITERHSCPDGSIFSGIMCLPIPLATCEEEEIPTNNLCLGLRDGFHGNYQQGCRDYFYCSGFKPVFKSVCPKNKIWKLNQCVTPKDNHCLVSEPSKDCAALPTGLYQDKRSWCKQYYYCNKGNKTLLICPKGEVFDGDSCTDEKEYTCPSLERNTCFGKADGYRVEEQSGCKSYYYCSNNYKTTYVCPNNTSFNGSMCVEEIKYRCPYGFSECNRRDNGYYTDFNSLCKKYYYCHAGNKLNILECGKHKIFDGRHCVYTTNPKELCKRVENETISIL